MSNGLCIKTNPWRSTVIDSRPCLAPVGRKGGRGSCFFGDGALLVVDPATALPASRPERAPAIGLRFVTALGFTRSGSNSRFPLPLAFLSGVGLCGSAITSTSSAVRPRSAGKRRDVIELVKSSAAMERTSAEQQNDRTFRRLVARGEPGGTLQGNLDPTPTPPNTQKYPPHCEGCWLGRLHPRRVLTPPGLPASPFRSCATPAPTGRRWARAAAGCSSPTPHAPPST